MELNDKCCTLVPYFEVEKDKLAEFKALAPEFVAKTKNEDGVMHYGFSLNGNMVHCREGYENAEAILAHLDNVGELLGKALALATIARLEVHAPASEIDKLKQPLKDLNPEFYTMEIGFRR